MNNNIKKDFTLNKIKYRCEVVKQDVDVVCVRIISPGKKRNIYSWGSKYKAPYIYKDNDVVLPDNVIAKAYSILGFDFSSVVDNHKDNVEIAATHCEVQSTCVNTTVMYKVINTSTGSIAMFTDSTEAMTYCIGKTVKVDTFNLPCEQVIVPKPIIQEEVKTDAIEESSTIIDDTVQEDIDIEIEEDDEIVVIKNTAPVRSKVNTVDIDHENDDEEEVVELIE